MDRTATKGITRSAACKYYHERLFRKYAREKGYIGNYCPQCQETECSHHIDNHHLPVILLALSAGSEAPEVENADY